MRAGRAECRRLPRRAGGRPARRLARRARRAGAPGARGDPRGGRPRERARRRAHGAQGPARPRHARAPPAPRAGGVQRLRAPPHGRGAHALAGRASRRRGEPVDAPHDVRLTVAWDLSWYQWEVRLADEPAPRALGRKGSEIEQLAESDRTGTRARATTAACSSPRGETAPRERAAQARRQRRRRRPGAIPAPPAIAAVVADPRRRGPRGARRADRPGDQQRRRVPGAAARHRARPRARGRRRSS